MDGPPTGWGGGGPDSKQQSRGGPPHRGGYYPGTWTGAEQCMHANRCVYM